MLDNIKNIIIVLSGKGGVGKSTISTQLALGLQESGYKIGLLDVDLCGPSVPYLLGLEGREIYQGTSDDGSGEGSGGWLPIYTDDSKSLAVMSIAFLMVSRDDPVIWRGPKKNSMIKQFLTDVKWDELDYLIVDTPPGTSDEHISVMECIRSMYNRHSVGAIIVTTPQNLALDDVRKEITFCRKTSIHIIGIVENMSGYVCPHCSNCTNIFSSNGGKELATIAKVPLLGTLPIDPRLSTIQNNKGSIVTILPNSPSAISLSKIVQKVIELPITGTDAMDTEDS